MDDIFTKTIGGLITGGLLYLCFYVFPPIKKRLMEKFEKNLETKGLHGKYMKVYKIIKSFLVVLLVAMIAGPIILFLYMLIF